MKRAQDNKNNTLYVESSSINRSSDESPMFKPKNNVLSLVNSSTKPSVKAPVNRSVKVVKRNNQPKNVRTTDLVPLNQHKRDLRSIEQIQHELKQKTKASNDSKILDSNSSPEKFYAKNYSSIISNIFGYNRNEFNDECSDEDLLDMVSDYRTLQAEDARSTRMGIKEDLEEEFIEAERKRRKATILKSQKHNK